MLGRVSPGKEPFGDRQDFLQSPVRILGIDNTAHHVDQGIHPGLLLPATDGTRRPVVLDAGSLLPVLKENLDQPSQRVRGRDVYGAPTQIAGQQIPIVLLTGIFQGHDKPLLLMRTDGQSGATEDDGDGLTAPEAQGHDHARMNSLYANDKNERAHRQDWSG